jgi:KTSC domain
MPSTSLRDITYDPDSRTLDVTFIASGKRYRYFDVSIEEYDALRNAASQGAWFNARIKPMHDFELVFEGASARGPFLRP